MRFPLRIKLFVPLVVGASLATVATYKVSSSSPKQREPQQLLEEQRGTASWYATQAKSRGETRGFLPTMISDHPSPRSLDEALLRYRPVVVQLIENKSQLFNEWERIITWCKFKVLEDLSTNAVGCRTCGKSELEPPAEMLPLAADEILVAKEGGEVEVDGVKLVEVDRYLPEFILSKKYLLFLSPTEPATVATPLAVGTFRLTEESVLLALFDEREPQPLIAAMAAHYGNSLDQMRTRLNSRH